MQGILAGILTSVDVIGLFVLIPNVRYRLFLAVWTATLHMLFPLLGFELGSYLVRFLLEWGQWISSILLFSIGLHLLLSSHKNEKITISPVLLAVTASLDTFSVSVSFGMLNLEKTIFIISAGLSAFICSYGSLVLARRSQVFFGNKIQIIAGIIFIVMSILAIKK
ncbi:putative manganese efflux pump MntP [Lysinibacillus sphaericus]|uniref:Putative manganese efflux pump MntP n=1 Tax=Lysinibacillus sphaericus TaxID=1421 RepID=A0A2S5D4X0_LYSSH|nr:manganese efflux pump [Lysinibacillus sphaericus]POZ58125.1 putative manganese efflux pump MntP [Lysinibacillus sphaericus]